MIRPPHFASCRTLPCTRWAGSVATNRLSHGGSPGGVTASFGLQAKRRHLLIKSGTLFVTVSSPSALPHAGGTPRVKGTTLEPTLPGHRQDSGSVALGATSFPDTKSVRRNHVFLRHTFPVAPPTPRALGWPPLPANSTAHPNTNRKLAPSPTPPAPPPGSARRLAARDGVLQPLVLRDLQCLRRRLPLLDGLGDPNWPRLP